MSDPKPEVTLVVESYNVTEASSLERLGTVLGAAARMVAEHGSARLFVTDAAGDPALADLLARELPQAHVVDARGLGYEEAKLKAAQEAESEIVLYLDGDCVPGPGWIEAHLAVLRSKAHATAGFTRYDGGGWQGTIETILDFGFLLPAGDRDLACYSSNNSGFRRSTLLEEPHPDGPMRCRCFAHAQNLLRRGTPVRMVPDARVVHERVPFVSERYRRGAGAHAPRPRSESRGPDRAWRADRVHRRRRGASARLARPARARAQARDRRRCRRNRERHAHESDRDSRLSP